MLIAAIIFGAILTLIVLICGIWFIVLDIQMKQLSKLRKMLSDGYELEDLLNEKMPKDLRKELEKMRE